ncbi:MAG: amino acid-binding protein [Mucinivorans sp.]
MKITQLSVFLENRSGRLNEITHILSSAGVNLDAFCLAEANDFGILRMVVSDAERAKSVLREHNIAARTTEVICLECPNEPGQMGKILDRLAERGVFIEYMYAFSRGSVANVVIRPTDIEACCCVLGMMDQRITK